MGNVKRVEIDPFKEQLIEVINDFFGCDAAYFDVNPFDLATHLIANGVTVQEWIPVTERLPEVECHHYSVDVLCYAPNKLCPFIGYAFLDTGEWYCPREKESLARGDVTHWMPLPQPPKGE